MHFSAKRGIAIACRLSDCLSVCPYVRDNGHNGDRKPPSLFLMVIADPYDLPFRPKWGFHMPPVYANGHISATGDPIHFMFGSRYRVFGDNGSNGAISGSNKSKMAAAAIWGNFEWPYLRNSSRSTYIARIARSSLR